MNNVPYFQLHKELPLSVKKFKFIKFQSINSSDIYLIHLLEHCFFYIEILERFDNEILDWLDLPCSS